MLELLLENSATAQVINRVESTLHLERRPLRDLLLGLLLQHLHNLLLHDAILHELELTEEFLVAVIEHHLLVPLLVDLRQHERLHYNER